MRIIAGTAGGTLLVMPKGPPIRPTPDKVKQAIFSSLGERLGGARVLDLYCGTGALGLEALSRGASGAVFVDESRFSIEAARANATRTRLEDRVEIHRAESLEAIAQLARSGAKFDIVLADPPYEKSARREGSVTKMLLNCPNLISILARDGVLVIEHFKNDQVEPAPCWKLHRQLRHGDTLVSFFLLQP